MSKVKGSGLEYQAAMAQEQLRGATPSPRSGWRLGGATPHLRPGAEAMAAWAQEGLEELSHDEGQEGRQ